MVKEQKFLKKLYSMYLYLKIDKNYQKKILLAERFKKRIIKKLEISFRPVLFNLKSKNPL